MSNTESTSAPAPTETTPAPETGAADLSVELAKWKAQAKKNEDRAKANAAAATELAAVKASQMTEVERAVQAARNEATSEARKTFGSRLVAAELKAATAGRQVDVDALLEGIDPSRFLDDDGEPNVAAIAQWVDRVAPASADQQPLPPLFPDLGQGPRGDAVPLNSDALTVDLKRLLGIT